SRPTSSPSPKGVTFRLTPEPGVTASGTITLLADQSTTAIELKVSGLQANSSHVSHIHLGTCQSRGGIAFALNQVVADGQGDAEDLTQQVALKAIPRLRQNAAASSIRGYLFATARSVLGGFWSTRLGLSEAELHEDLMLSVPPEPPSEGGTETAQRILAQLSDNYRRVLELRFLYVY